MILEFWMIEGDSRVRISQTTRLSQKVHELQDADRALLIQSLIFHWFPHDAVVPASHWGVFLILLINQLTSSLFISNMLT